MFGIGITVAGLFDLIKKKQVQLNDIFGVNLHSIPNNRKKYPPKPNLYAFFIALGLVLLKEIILTQN